MANREPLTYSSVSSQKMIGTERGNRAAAPCRRRWQRNRGDRGALQHRQHCMVTHVADDVAIQTQTAEHGNTDQCADDKRRPELSNVRRPFTQTQGQCRPQRQRQGDTVGQQRDRLLAAARQLIQHFLKEASPMGVFSLRARFLRFLPAFRHGVTRSLLLLECCLKLWIRLEA